MFLEDSYWRVYDGVPPDISRSGGGELFKRMAESAHWSSEHLKGCPISDDFPWTAACVSTILRGRAAR
jgi:hypothetical protein